MDIKMMTMALLQFGVALFSGILIMYVAFSLIRRFLLQRFPNAYTNPAFGILCAAILFSVGYLMSGIVAPAVSFFRIQSGQLTSTDYLVFRFFQYLLLFAGIGLAVSLLVNFVSLRLFNFLTRDVDEMEEIRKGNIAVALIAAAILVVISLFVRDSVVFLLESMIPYPEVPNLR
jgi:hypothetical protein